MEEYRVRPIGWVRVGEEGMRIELAEGYAPALTALEGFSHINLLWWCSLCDGEEARGLLQTERPYQKAPETMGVFATRSPARPNPIALSVAGVLGIDHEHGIVWIDYTDAQDGTPVLDLKPYTPSIDRVESPGVPDWCAHWPMSVEGSGEFDWESEFLF